MGTAWDGAAACNRGPRLFIEAPLHAGQTYSCDVRQANYLLNVLRLGAGGRLLVFNGRDGEWLAELAASKRGRCTLHVTMQTRPQTDGPDIHYLFAPLKRARQDYMVQKAAEMGAAALKPVITRRTMAERVNTQRMRANAIEAAEQCGILRVPEIYAPEKLTPLLASWPDGRHLIYCDEAAPIASPLEALRRIPPGPLAVLTGPEGGFEPEEREHLRGLNFVYPISLGPRVMRADTAGVAALALVNAVLGDWRN